MKIEIERGYPYDNPFARGTEFRIRILRSPLWFFTHHWCGPEFRPWRKFLGDYLDWRKR